MMIVMKLWLILSVSAAAPLNSNVHKESVEENLASDDIGSVDIVKGDDMDGDGLHSHSTQDTGRDAKLVFTGGSVSIGNIGNINAQVKIASIMSNIDPHDEPAPDPVCPADVAVTTDCMCAGISCATGSTCVGGSTCTSVCPADVAVTKDCMCAGISCATGSICVGGSTCTAVCPADVAITKDCMCADISCATGSTCVGGSTCTAASCVVNVGSSTDSKITSATVSEGCLCPVVVTKDGYEFKVTQDGSSLNVERTDSDVGWEIDLSFECYKVCTPNAKTFATCICKSANGEREETCSYNQGCTKDGTCINDCVGELQSNCMCENPWDELTACTKEQICHSGTCLRDPELCKIVSSEKCDLMDDVKKFCPIKCGNHHQPDDICSIADCDRLDSKEFCPIECEVPDCPVSSELVPLVEDCVCKSTNPTNHANQAEPCRKGKTCHGYKGCEVINSNNPDFWPFLLVFG